MSIYDFYYVSKKRERLTIQTEEIHDEINLDPWLTDLWGTEGHSLVLSVFNGTSISVLFERTCRRFQTNCYKEYQHVNITWLILTLVPLAQAQRCVASNQKVEPVYGTLYTFVFWTFQCGPTNVNELQIRKSSSAILEGPNFPKPTTQQFCSKIQCPWEISERNTGEFCSKSRLSSNIQCAGTKMFSQTPSPQTCDPLQSRTACSCQTPSKLDCHSLTMPSPPVDASVIPPMSHSSCHT